MSDITTSRVFTDGERGITAQKLNDITASSTIQPAFYSSKPTAPTADPADIALILKAGAYAQVPISALAGSATQAQIWSTRLNSYNAIVGNPNFEVDQRNAGVAIVNAANGAWLMDRYSLGKVGTHTLNTAQESGAIVIPGTSFNITQKRLLLQLTTAQASLAAGDYLQFNHTIEGPSWREIGGGVFSVSLLVYSDVALKFTFAIRGGSLSMVKLCTVPAATWSIVSLPNIPPPGTPFTLTPGVQACAISITLSCGTTFIAPAADTWQSGNFFGAPGMDNWSSKPVNTGFRIAALQLEPGAVCTTLMDKPFSQNLDECLRYYTKTWNYGQAPGVSSQSTMMAVYAAAAQYPYGSFVFPKPMAKSPTVVTYNPYTANRPAAVYDTFAAVERAVTSYTGVGERGFSCPVLSTTNAGVSIYNFHYTADTGM